MLSEETVLMAVRLFSNRKQAWRLQKIRDPMRGPLGIPDCPAQQELFQKALPPSLFAERWRTGADCMRDARRSRNVSIILTDSRQSVYPLA